MEPASNDPRRPQAPLFKTAKKSRIWKSRGGVDVGAAASCALTRNFLASKLRRLAHAQKKPTCIG